MSFSAYPTYKDSGAEWLGDVPTHWPIERLRVRASLITAKAEAQTRPIALENIEGWSGKLIESETEFQSDGVSFETGDILFGKLRPYLAKVHAAEFPGQAVGDFHVIRPAGSADTKFIAYCLLTRELISLIDGSTFGARMPRASWDFIREVRIAFPPLDEQVAIAAFLDHETGKIDALIEEQRRLIALLKEKRQAVISHAVTKGLDPHAPMKDSGIEWLGEVPAHWTVKPLKRIGRFNAGAGFPHEEQGTEGEELSFHKVNALGKAGPDGILPVSEDTISRETATRLRAFIFPARSIVFAKIGAALLLGRIRQLDAPACLDNNMMGLIVGDQNNADFIRHLMTLVRFDLIANPGTVPSLNEGQIANVSFAFPPPAEQEAIAGFLRSQLGRFDDLTAEAGEAIYLLNERRAALISAAVTGKIDVRAAATEQEREAA